MGQGMRGNSYVDFALNVRVAELPPFSLTEEDPMNNAMREEDLHEADRSLDLWPPLAWKPFGPGGCIFSRFGYQGSDLFPYFVIFIKNAARWGGLIRKDLG